MTLKKHIDVTEHLQVVTFLTKKGKDIIEVQLAGDIKLGTPFWAESGTTDADNKVGIRLTKETTVKLIKALTKMVEC